MGRDIHMVVERRVDGVWTRIEAVPAWPCAACKLGLYPDGSTCRFCLGSALTTRVYDERDYSVFAALSGWHAPIAAPRGLPKDATRAVGLDRFGAPAWDGEHGEHLFSWLLLSEVLAHDWSLQNVGADNPFVVFAKSLVALGDPKDTRLVFGFDC